MRETKETTNGTCFVQLSGSFEEAWQRGLQHHDKVLQLLCYSDQHVFIHQVVFRLLQSPLAAHIPAQRSRRLCVVSFSLSILKKEGDDTEWQQRRAEGYTDSDRKND